MGNVQALIERLHDHARNVGGDDSFERLYGSEAVEIATALSELVKRVEVLEAENGELRRIISELGYCTPDASLEFMALIPAEVRQARSSQEVR
jgi:hypothetical protein